MNRPLPRRDFLKFSAVAGAIGALGTAARATASDIPTSSAPAPVSDRRAFGTPYSGAHLNRLAFPLGGIGAGMIALEGTGALSHVSLRHRPEVFHEPCVFAALSVRDAAPVSRVLEGPIPAWKLFGTPNSARGYSGASFGLPRFAHAEFSARFPFATVALVDPQVPLRVELTGWSPFAPGDADASSLPVAAIEYRFSNPTAQPLDAVFSFAARNFVSGKERPGAVRATPGGFVLWGGAAAGRPQDAGSFAAAVDDPSVKVNHAWFRGGWADALTMAWAEIDSGAAIERPPVTEGPPAPGATLAVPFRLEPGASRTIALRLCWHFPLTDLRTGKELDAVEGSSRAPAAADEPASERYYRPWYPAHFPGIADIARHWAERYAELRATSARFAECLHDTTLPPEITEAVAANLAILKSPTILRQADGRLWAWEGCGDDAGSGAGTCAHVWNYAQAIAHLFPSLERTLRETEFGPGQDERGHQTFRVPLPIRPGDHSTKAAADGQLGGILKLHRDWRIGGDTAWLRGLWPRVRRSLDFCIATWDPRRRGWLEEPQHNTYDIQFWGPNGMCTSIYLATLRAAVQMGRTLGDNVAGYEELLERGRTRAEAELFDGDYYFQKTTWKGLDAREPQGAATHNNLLTPEVLALVEKEGPKYQYGSGCLADGVIGEWFAAIGGVEPVLAPKRIASHLRAVHRHNLKRDLTGHANPQRPTYAANDEGGLLLCTWPKGGKPSLPFVYSEEVWTGIEYQVASHLIMTGDIDAGLEIVRVCRARYDGRVRNPFDEYEWGHWYGRALSSYALLQAMSGARYDAVERVLHLAPPRAGDFRCFLATATGYGTVGVRNGQPFLEVRSGTIPLARIDYTVAARA